MDLSRKSILFISPAFFGYETAIKNALTENGYDVDFFDERTSNNSVLKAIFRVEKRLLNFTIVKYYQRVLRAINEKRYHYFFLIKGEVVPHWFITAFRKLNPHAKLIYYTYDSFNNNNSNSIYILKHFDKCYSFDFEDVKANPSLILKHLFYTKEFINIPTFPSKKKYTISFIGTLHSNRYHTIKNLLSKFNNVFLFFYLPARWLFVLNKLTKRGYKQLKWAEVSFDKLSRQQVAEIFKCSGSVLDIQRFGQSGLTMRTFEVLASQAMLVTTNAHIKQADFYDDEYIIVLDEGDLPDMPAEIKNKIELAGVKKTKKIDLEKYYINNWVLEFFE